MTTGATVIPIRQTPLIRTGPAIHEQGDAAVAVLAADPNLYQQGGHLVRVVRVDPSEATPQKPDGTPEVRRIATETLREQLSRYARWEKFDIRADAWIPCAPPQDVAAAVSKRGEWRGLRPLDAVSETPIVRPDMSILETPGYDAATRVLYLPGFQAMQVRSAPTLEQSKAALAALLELVKEIPFEKEEQKFVFIAALLSLFARPAIVGAVPAFAFDASTPGSGKSLLVQVISCIFTGRPSEPNTYSADPVELEKSLGGEALSGAPIIDFDNIEDPVEGGPLLKCLTAPDKVRLRVLGTNTKLSIRWRPIVLLGGNNLEIGRQMSRRVLMARIEPKEENPEDREGFEIGDLPAHCMEHRARLIAACFTIIRGWIAAGRPASAKSMGSFPAWSRIVPQCIKWVSGFDVTRCKPAGGAKRDDPERASLRALLPFWARLAGSPGLTTREALEVLYPGGVRPPRRDRFTGETLLPDEWEPMRAAVEGLCPSKAGGVPTPHALGIKLRKFKGSWFGKQRIVNVEDTDGNKAGKWTVETVR